MYIVHYKGLYSKIRWVKKGEEKWDICKNTALHPYILENILGTHNTSFSFLMKLNCSHLTTGRLQALHRTHYTHQRKAQTSYIVYKTVHIG